MKLQKEELSAVVKHIYDEIKKKNEVCLTKSEEKEIKELVEKREKLYKESSELTEKANDLLKAFKTKYKFNTNFYGNGVDLALSLKKELVKIKSNKIPSQEEIRQQVVMKSLFSDEKELKTFIKELVDKY